MLRKLTMLLLAISLTPLLLNAQSKKVFIPKAPIRMVEPVAKQNPLPGPGFSTAAANYVAVDTMANSLGPASPTLNPLAYDPASNVLAVVHRGKSSYGTSGQIWYNISTDMGLTWSRVSAVNAGNVQKVGRYPSMTISNPAGGDISQTTGVFSWPELNPSAFGFVGYAADQPIGAGASFSAIDQGPPAYGSNVPCWASDTSPWVFWASDNSVDAGVKLFKTSDFGVIDTLTPPQWADSVFIVNGESGGNIPIGGVAYKGVQYYGVIGTFDEFLAPTDVISRWMVGYSKSTDDGKTWSNFVVPDFRTIGNYHRLFDYVKSDAFVSYAGDINVDKDGKVHFLVALTTLNDTADTDHGTNDLVDLYETSAAPGWAIKKIVSLPDSAYSYTFDAPGLLSSTGVGGQMGETGYLAVNKDRDFFVTEWVGLANPTDTICDVFMSYRSLTGDWSTPMNLTNTPNMNENGAHLAPYLAQNGNTYTAFSMYYYEAGNTTAEYLNTNPAVVYVAPVNITVTGVNDKPGLVNSFELKQNYPNPFNPSTSIKYTVAQRSNVTLKIFDVLGREVSTLVNTVKDAGSYEVNFSASNLSSGLYLYTLSAGNYTSTKKMMLLK